MQPRHRATTGVGNKLATPLVAELEGACGRIMLTLGLALAIWVSSGRGRLHG
jgi:hypothetical protein